MTARNYKFAVHGEDSTYVTLVLHEHEADVIRTLVWAVNREKSMPCQPTMEFSLSDVQEQTDVRRLP